MFTIQNLLIFVFTVIFGLPWTNGGAEPDISSDLLQRNKRQLLFPNSTLLQFNAGIGTPTPAKNVNMNFAFQANFNLPWNRTQIPIDILYANSGYDGPSRKKRDEDGREEKGGYENDARLYHFYKYVEDVLNGFGYHGKSCVMRALCQLGSEPLHSEDDEDLLHELASFVLNPNNDVSSHPSHRREGLPYKDAFNRGQKSKNCTKIYQKCTLSLVDIFTKLHDVS